MAKGHGMELARPSLTVISDGADRERALLRQLETERDANAALREEVERLRMADEALRVRFSLVSKATSEGMWAMEINQADPLGVDNPFWWSDQFRHLIGYRDEQDFPSTLGSWSNLLHPDDREQTLAAAYAHLRDPTGRTPYDVTFQLKVKSGAYRWFRARGESFRDADGNALRVAGSLADITEQRHGEVEKERALTRFDLTRELLSDGVWDMEVIAGDPVNPRNPFWWSRQFRYLLGYQSAEEFPNVLDSWASRLHPDEQAGVLAAFRAHLLDYSGGTPYDMEHRLRCADGAYRWFRAWPYTARRGRRAAARGRGPQRHHGQQARGGLSPRATRPRGGRAHLAPAGREHLGGRAAIERRSARGVGQPRRGAPDGTRAGTPARPALVGFTGARRDAGLPPRRCDGQLARPWPLGRRVGNLRRRRPGVSGPVHARRDGRRSRGPLFLRVLRRLRAPAGRGTACRAPARRGRHGRQVALPGAYEPRAAHAAQRHPRLFRAAGARPGAVGGQPRDAGNHPPQRRPSAGADQRRPRHRQDRGRPAGPQAAALRPAGDDRRRARHAATARPRARRAAATAAGAGLPAPHRGRLGQAAPGAAQSDLERH